jgi:hypothetical protein
VHAENTTGVHRIFAPGKAKPDQRACDWIVPFDGSAQSE